ncbi:MAG TPA: hypothetical protein VE891_14850 [Allosphingosinicella sp.]|nr:hypothetical protein [Allosphingosinicella sp.]
MDRTDSRPAPSTESASDDAASPLDSAAVGDPPPWEGDPPEEAGRRRHDAFTGAKKQLYLKALAKTGCILDACRIAGISSSTVYNHQASDPDFARYCEMAVGMASTPLELTAYERAVVGQEEDVIRGGKVVGTRIKRSDYMLRVLLQGADPKKYGARPGFSRKRLLKAERKQIEREVRAEIAEPRMSFEDSIEMLDQALEHFGHRANARRLAEGWTDLGGGVWIPPGWTWTGEGDPSEAVAALEKNDDAVCNSSNSSTSAERSSPGFPGKGSHAPGTVEGSSGVEEPLQRLSAGPAPPPLLAEERGSEPFARPTHSLDSAPTGETHGRSGHQGPRGPAAAHPRGDAAMDLGDGARPADDARACRQGDG